MGVPGNANALLLRSAAAAGGYQVSRSLRFNSADSAYLSRTPASAGNRKTWTWSGWVKRAGLGGDQQLFYAAPSTSDTSHIRFDSDDTLHVFEYTGSFTWRLQTSQVFRDVSAWYHILIAVDSTQATASNRVKIYVNGSQVTAFSTASYPSQNTDTEFNNTVEHSIGRNHFFGNYFNGYLADIYFLDGTATTPSTFAETDAITGQWVPKTPTGISYGTNGFKLTFADNSAATAAALGKDTSGNGNNWTPNNFSVTAGAGNDSLVDTPTSYGTDTGAGGEVRGNYCTLNPLDKHSEMTLANGNLDASVASPSNWRVVRSTFGITAGKWYWEVTCVGTYTCIGINLASAVLNDSVDPNKSYAYCYDGLIRTGVLPNTSYGGSFGNGDIIGVAYDADNGTLAFYKNGTSLGQAFSGIPANTWFPYVTHYTSSGSYWNFGQRPFAYQTAGTNRPASTYKALVDTNLTAPVIAKPNTVMDVALYTGNGSTKTISGLGFSPDFVWIKRRDAAGNHALFDVIRGTGKFLESSTTGSESTSANSLTAFNSDGFSLGTETQTNTNNATYVGWVWDAGTSTVTNTQGSITSSVRANASAGFSIVTWTGASGAQTVGHGLGVAPELIITKSRGAAGNWYVYSKALGAGYYLMLNLTNASDTSTTAWNNTAPTSTVFSLNSSSTNPPSTTLVAYCFAPVAGYSSFGSYTGNGSSDGPFVYTGFRPRWIMVKRSDSTGNWTIKDTSRPGYNVTNLNLFANLSNAETTEYPVDLLSNGFKVREGTFSDWNANGGTYVWAAFAESPFAYARAR